MGSGTDTTTGRVRVVTSKDRLEAWIEFPGAASPRFSPPSEEELISTLTEKGIELTDAVRARVGQYLQTIGEASQGDRTRGRPEIPERFLIAKGRPAVEPEDGRFAWDKAFDKQARDWQGDAPVNYYALNSVLTIEAGTRIGRIIPPTEGEVGEDVFGKELLPRRRKGLPLKLGNGLRTATEDPLQVVTEVPGWLAQEGNTIRMSEVLRIAGDVDFRSGNVDSVIDVHVCGSVKPNFSVKTSRSLTIERAVEAAELDAGEDIQVRGGLFGQESGRLIRAGGSITASICDGARVEASGDICISKEIINSTLRTAGELRIEHGAIIGGEIFARNGVKLKHTGTDLGVPTRIAVGMDGAVLHRVQQMERQIRRHQQQAKQIRTRVKLLLSNVKRFTSAQRELGTELMSKANEIESVANNLLAEREQMLERAKPEKNPGVDVTGTLYPGVLLVFGLREARIRSPVKGPVRVEEGQVKGAMEIVVVNQLTASVVPLPSITVDVTRFKTVEQAASEPGGVEEGQSDSARARPRHNRR